MNTSSLAVIFALLTVVPANATILDVRVTERKSVVCASLLVATRAASTPESARAAREAFRTFREDVLDARPVLDVDRETTVNVHSSSRWVAREKLIRRAYAVERSFDRATSSDRQIIATARLAGDDDILRFLANTATTKRQFAATAGKINGRLRGVDILDVLPDIQYGAPGALLALHAFAWSCTSTVGSIGLLILQPGAPESLGFHAFTAVSAAAGVYDYPARYVASIRFDTSSLAAALAKMPGREWLYWSRDFTVAPEFVEDLLSPRAVDWATTVRREDYRELTSGLRRYRDATRRRAAGRSAVRFAIDVLGRRIDGQTEVTIVLRSRPRAAAAVERSKVEAPAGSIPLPRAGI